MGLQQEYLTVDMPDYNTTGYCVKRSGEEM
jgi:hypothetical protein